MNANRFAARQPRCFRAALRALLFTAALGATLTAFAAKEARIESTRPVLSPDKKVSIVVDQISPIVDGEPERYSGRLMIRLTSPEGKTLRQRFVEASQVRLLNQPFWLDSQWCAFTYNISKNSTGVALVDVEKGRVLVAEIVSTSRKMSATRSVQTEVTDLEVADYGDTVTRISNITHGCGSVFPLHIDRIYPQGSTELQPATLRTSLEQSLSAWSDFLTKNKLSSVRLEQSTESFSGDDKMMATLGCADGKAAVILVPVTAESARKALEGARVIPAGVDMALSCLQDTPEESDDDSAASTSETPSGSENAVRYSTSWKGSSEVLVERETFVNEEEAPKKETVLTVTTDGKVTVSPAATTTATATPAPTPKPAAKQAATPVPVSRPKPKPASQATPPPQQFPKPGSM